MEGATDPTRVCCHCTVHPHTLDFSKLTHLLGGIWISLETLNIVYTRCLAYPPRDNASLQKKIITISTMFIAIVLPEKMLLDCQCLHIQELHRHLPHSLLQAQRLHQSRLKTLGGEG